jgi:uncharacterized membrane protein YqjE
MLGGVAELSSNLIALAELQARLAAIEWNENREKARAAILCAGLGTVLAMATLPVLLIAIAEGLVWMAGVDRGPAYLGVALGSLLIAGCSILVGLILLKRRGLGFPRTREELSRNWRWVRTVLTHSGRPIPPRKID